jgi:esterase/lipase superfamily enzyme
MCVNTTFKNLLSIGMIFFLFGCASSKKFTLMPTPIIYQHAQLDPFSHLPPAQRSTETRIFYASNRTRKPSTNQINYGNNLDSVLHLGQATIRMGDSGFSWEDLYVSCTNEHRKQPVPIALEQSFEMAHFPIRDSGPPSELSPEVRKYLAVINAELAESRDKEIMLYVHGTKVDFENATILTAEIDHFSGRDFVGIAFSWPSHQNIFYYLTGIDVRHALESSLDLENFIQFLSRYTIARRINILSYSAGGKVTFFALSQLRHRFFALDADGLQKKFRIGAVIFAAADIPENNFLSELRCVSQMAEQIMITLSDNDNALRIAKKFMGGRFRTGSAMAEKEEDDFIELLNLSNVQIVDVSMGKEKRGFDIIGHHYWYRHPWMSSDIIFLMRTNQHPSKRGLSPAELKSVWYLSKEYPQKAKEALEKELGSQW